MFLVIEHLYKAQNLIRASLSDSRSVLPFVPKPIKLLALIILIVNFRGLPFIWHLRVFRPAAYARISHAIRSIFQSRRQRLAHLTNNAPVGANPFTHGTVFKTRATVDACDYYLHLSNSSYGQTYDMARMKYIMHNLPFVLPDGCWMGLASTHFVFHREIPFNSPFEIRLSIATWDTKWIYVISRFVTYQRKKSGKPSANPSSQTNHWIGPPLPLNAVLHCTAVAKGCFKFGRITIPPAIMLTANGFCLSPKQYETINALRFQSNGKQLKELYKGGWKELSPEGRWWEAALSGEIEKTRVENLKLLPETLGLSNGSF